MPDMVSAGDEPDASYHHECMLLYHLLSRLNDRKGMKRKQPVFSLESSETEFSLEYRTSDSICSPLLSEDMTSCASSASPIKHKVVLIHLSSGSKVDVDVD